MAGNKRRPLLPPGTPMLDANAPDFEKRLREAIGAGPDEKLTFSHPQFERPWSDPRPAAPPSDWMALRSMTYAALKEIGLRAWDEPDSRGMVLMLLPGEWYAHIPDGYGLRCIDGTLERFKRGETDDDIRYGCLAFGIEVLRGR